MKIKSALKAVAVASALIFSGASQAAIQSNATELGLVLDGGAMLNPVSPGAQAVEVYELTGTSLADSLLAFCIQPTVAQLNGTVYTGNTISLASQAAFADNGVDHRANRIQSLFEQQYAGLSSGTADQNSVKRLAFQLALWDLVADDGDLRNTSGHQYFTDDAIAFNANTGDSIDLNAAQQMLASTVNAPLTNAYKFTLFTGKAGGVDSQALLSVSAVPEVDTWAMLAAGLGMMGLVARRRSDKSEKFAA